MENIAAQFFDIRFPFIFVLLEPVDADRVSGRGAIDEAADSARVRVRRSRRARSTYPPAPRFAYRWQ